MAQQKIKLGNEYKITIVNNSGADHKIGIYQTNPTKVKGSHPLIWMNEGIGNGDRIDFEWKLSYQHGLSWGNTALKQGVVVKGKSKLIDLIPGNNQKNGVIVDYYPNNDIFKCELQGQSDLNKSQLYAECTSNWVNDKTKKKNLCLMLYCYKKPIMAFPARPGYDVTYDLHPTYYLCLNDMKEGTAVTAHAKSKATKVVFANGKNELKYEIQANNAIEELLNVQD